MGVLLRRCKMFPHQYSSRGKQMLWVVTLLSCFSRFESSQYSTYHQCTFDSTFVLFRDEAMRYHHSQVLRFSSRVNIIFFFVFGKWLDILLPSVVELKCSCWTPCYFQRSTGRFVKYLFASIQCTERMTCHADFAVIWKGWHVPVFCVAINVRYKYEKQ